MRRRALLAGTVGAAATGLSAGCLGIVPGVGGSDCTAGRSIDLEPTTPADTAAAAATAMDELPPTGRALLSAAVDGASGGRKATVDGIDEPPVPREYALVDGTYYRVTTTTVDGRDVPGYEFGVESGSMLSDEPAPSETVAFGDLPAVDRRAVRAGLDYPSADHRAAGRAGTLALAYPDEAARAASVLVPDPTVDAVDYRGTVYRLRPEGTTTVTWHTYAVAADPIADSAAAFAEFLYDRLGVVVERKALSAGAREILAEADGEGGYTACEPYSDAEQAVLDALEIETEGTDRRYALYANYEDYWHRVAVARFVV